MYFALETASCWCMSKAPLFLVNDHKRLWLWLRDSFRSMGTIPNRLCFASGWSHSTNSMNGLHCVRWKAHSTKSRSHSLPLKLAVHDLELCVLQATAPSVGTRGTSRQDTIAQVGADGWPPARCPASTHVVPAFAYAHADASHEDC